MLSSGELLLKLFLDLLASLLLGRLKNKYTNMRLEPHPSEPPWRPQTCQGTHRRHSYGSAENCHNKPSGHNVVEVHELQERLDPAALGHLLLAHARQNLSISDLGKNNRHTFWGPRSRPATSAWPYWREPSLNIRDIQKLSEPLVKVLHNDCLLAGVAAIEKNDDLQSSTI